MFDLVVRIVVRKVLLTTVVFSVAGCLSDWGFGGGDVDLKKATWLVAEKVPLVVDKGGVPVGSGGTVTPVSNLFNQPLGAKIPVSAFSGAIDSTGTTIVNDFDGDGILNSNETTTNVWVADYPEINAKVAPPVTMKIEILNETSGEVTDVVSEIHADDIENTKNVGTEKIHQKEINLRTVQFQDSFSISGGVSTSSGFNIGGSPAQAATSGAGLNYGQTNSNSWQGALGQTVTKWATRPFKNNIDRDASSLKSDSTGKNSRNYRTDKRQKTSTSTTIKPNAGYVRAALYITNESVNMPVKLTNILCSLMFENAAGDLIPVESFRLRNDDFSLFEVSVYGGSEFGPYVVELTGLNRVEIEQAITAGYNPKIFIVDYEMSHVPNSNYASSLLNFTGSNLKIIEENAKSRTALIKIFGQGIREMYRIAAFEATGGSSDPCATSNINYLSPGITFENATKRLNCAQPVNGSNMEIIFDNYVLDFSEIAPKLGDSKVFIRTIKSVAGRVSTVPCEYSTKIGSDGQQRTACIQKPLSQWSDAEKANAGIWVVFSKGKYYDPTAYVKNGSNKIIFDPADPLGAVVLQGANSKIWAGDYFDIVYYSIADYLAQMEAFGKNPLENGEVFSINTKWDKEILGNNPYDPDINSIYLGEASFGERIELAISLKKTQFLNPSFGSPALSGNFQYFTDFGYNRTVSTKRFSMEEAVDFEISFGFSGLRTDWFHVVKDLTPGNAEKIQDCGSYPDYQNQVFVRCIQLPSAHPLYDISKTPLKVFLRPAYNTAYRNTVWPLPYQNVRKLRAKLAVQAKVGDVNLKIDSLYGNIQQGDTIYLAGDSNGYVVSLPPSTPDANNIVTITISSAIGKAADRTTEVYVPGTLTSSEIRLAMDNNFISDWNAQYAATPTSYTTNQFVPLVTSSTITCSGANLFHPYGCLGFPVDFNVINWMGSYNKGAISWNSWSDGGYFLSFLASGLPSLATSTSRLFRFETISSDGVFYDPGSAVTLANPVTLSEGSNGVMIWKQGTLIKARFFDVSTGVLSTTPGDITVNTQPIGEDFVAKVQNGKVVVAWENGAQVYVRFLDMNTKALIGTESLVATRSYMIVSINDLSLDVAMGDNRTLIVWNENVACNDCGTHNFRGRLYQNSDGTSLNSVSTLYTISAGSGSTGRMTVAADATGDSAVIASVTGGHAIGLKFHTMTYQLSTATKGSVTSVDTYSVWADRKITVKVANGSALIVYGYLDKLFARGVNAITGTLTSIIPLSTGATLSNFKVTASGDVALVSYVAGNRIKLNRLSFVSGALTSPNALFLDTSATATSKSVGYTAVSGNSAISVWEHGEGSIKTIRGRIIDFSNFTAMGSGEFFLSTTNQGNQTGSTIQIMNNVALAVWLSQDADRARFRSFLFDLTNPGSIQYGLNNFFVAPLIERDYTVKGKILF
ncbi:MULTISPECIES: LIC12048 family lipoprotein [unclassified Leptospira]|uniref:LIC12048 family lipoprotein n=1 Tax=unclassified Leptospira TaxID=2633828 RepID=UPI0002BF6502|nr:MULTISPECIES: LIC12048 family lipoprotein [unclassified Leptospira]EMJ97896.1 putative lipoprotein [Leptospira sp. B5-022]MCR1795399.1 LIC12048 family lipoprotein [Leptospira sp. id769339]